MKKNYNNYLSSRLFNGLMKLSLLIVMLLLVTTSTFAQLSKTVKVSNNAELTQAIYNTDVTVITLSPGDYELLKLQVLPEEEVKIFLEEGNRSPSFECIYYIQTRATCWIDATTSLQVEAGMVPGGDNCATVDDGLWSVPVAGPGTPTFPLGMSVQVQNVTVTAAGVYGFKYTWANGRYVNGDYLWHDTPIIDVPVTYDVCGLTSSFTTYYDIGTGAFSQSDAWSINPGTATVTLTGTATSTVSGEIRTTKTWDIIVGACGTYSLTYTVENGPCIASENFQIKFYDTPVVNAGTDIDICGLGYDLIGTFTATCQLGTVTETWTKTGGPGTAIFTGDGSRVDVSECGTYSFTYTVNNGPCTSTPDFVVVNFFDTPTLVNAGTDAEVCGLSATLSPSETISCVNGGTPSKTWALTAGPGTATFTGTTSVTVSQCGLYTFTYTVDNGPCDPVSDLVVIKFFDTPTAVTAYAEPEVCGLTTSLSGSYTASCELGGTSTQTWSWEGPPGASTPTISGGGAKGFVYDWVGTVTVTMCGTYTFTYNVDNGACLTQSDPVVVNFYDTPSPVNAGFDDAFCGLVGSLSASYDASCELGGAATQTWTLVGPGTATYGTNTGGAQEWVGTVTVTTCGTYTFTYNVDNGPCGIVKDSVVLNFYDTPTLVEAAAVAAEVCGTQAIGGVTTTYTVGCAQGIVSDTWTYEAPGTQTATITRNMDKATINSWDVNVSGCGVYTFTYSVDNGLCLPVTDIVVINFFDTPTITLPAVPDVCGLSTSLGTPTVTVGCDPGDMVTGWTQTAGTGTSTFSGNSVEVSLCGSYTFTYSVTNAPCPLVSSTVNVKFYDTPVLTVHTPQTPTQVCGYETDYWVSYNANCELGTVTQTVTQTAGPGTSTITFCELVKTPCTSNITVSQCGLYTFTYTVDNGPCTETIDFPISFYEIPTFDIVGTVSPTLCAENTFAVDDLRACEFGTVTYTWVITGGYIDDGGAVTVTTTVGATETLTVVWDQNVTGNMTVVGATIEGCTWTDTFTVYPQMPTLAGQVKYWNNVETYMPTPFGTIENASYPHDYFYVTLYNGITALDTVLVEPYLTEDLDELMSYFQFDLGDWFPTYGCTGYSYKVWDGGLTYYRLNGDNGTTDGLLGANYTYRHWGGVNATDALAIQLMATNININGAPYNFSWVGLNTDTPRFGYYSSSAANVNSSTQTNPITALDALTTNYRAVGLLPVFPDTRYGAAHYSPNFRVTGRMVPSLPYTTWSTPFDLDNVDDVPFTKSANNYLYYNLATDHMYSSGALSLKKYDFINIYYLALGDVNSSYIPTDNGFKAASAMELEYTDEMTVAKGDIVTVPIRIDRNAQIGAISLNLTYNTGLIEVLGVNYEKDYYSVDAENGTIRIGWFDVVPADFGFGDAIALVKVRVLADITADTHFFELEEGTDLADASAQSLKDIKLQTSAIVTSDEGLFVTNYPNPFNGQTMISYFLPSDSKVVLVVYNTMSQVVETLVNANQNAGTHQVQFGSPALKPGVYYYKLVVESEGNTVVKTNSMIRMQ